MGTPLPVTLTTGCHNSFYKRMADTRLEKIKGEYCRGKGLSASLEGFWERPRRAAGPIPASGMAAEEAKASALLNFLVQIFICFNKSG